MPTPNDTTRTCKTCNRTLPLTLEFFPPAGKAKDGSQRYRYYCRECWRARERDYHATPEATEAKRKSRKRRDPDKVKAEKSRSQKKHRDSANRRSQKYVEKKLAENPDYHKERYQKDRDVIIARANQWVKDNRDRFNAAQRRRFATSPIVKMKASVIRQTRRARMRNAEGTHTPEDIQNIFYWQEGRCAYCGITLSWSIPGDVHIDHIQPLARGGSNWPDNLACTCADCNLSKVDKTLDEWVAARGW